jgi:plastocyanin
VLKKRIMGVSAGVLTAAVSAGAAFGATAAGGGSLPTLNVTASGKKVSLPASVPAGAVSVQVTVKGEKAASAAFVKLRPGATIKQVFDRLSKAHGDPNALKGYAAVLFDLPSIKGKQTAQTVLTPGNWFAVDLNVNGIPKATPFTVTKSGKAAKLPAADATVKMADFKFKSPATLHDGDIVRFVNSGKVFHMTVAAMAKNMASAKTIAADLKAGKDGKAQKMATGFTEFVDGASPGFSMQGVLTAKPGIYVLACFMATNGKEHTRLGMEKIVTVTK